MKISVVIPALNEAENVREAIASARAEGGEGGGGEVEVIVVDGGSSDETSALAEAAGVRVVRSSAGRGVQMDAGAEAASGDLLLFLHADTKLPEGWYGAIRNCMEDEGVAGGGFTLAIDAPGPGLRLVERGARLRYKLFGLIYGDQAIFVRRELFLKVGGFRGLPLMEDVDLVRRLAAAGRVVCLPERITTSARRWIEPGVAVNTFKNWSFVALYYLGVSPTRLYGWYYGRDAARAARLKNF
ncbi:MAG: TIGR04283 family arsenosugar biosynthesis glycosyltransferase [Thermodesulfobacteriota bacterium]